MGATQNKDWDYIGDVYGASSRETLPAAKSLIAGFTLPPAFIKRLLDTGFDKGVDFQAATQTWLRVEEVVKNEILIGALKRIEFQIDNFVASTHSHDGKTYMSRTRDGKYLTNPSEKKATKYGCKDTVTLMFNEIAALFKELVARNNDDLDLKYFPKERAPVICDVQKVRRMAIGATCKGLQEVLETYERYGVPETVEKVFRSWACESSTDEPFRSLKLQKYVDLAYSI